MTKKNFIIDTTKKEIGLNPEVNLKSCSVKELYSYLMDEFDEPEYMRFDVPIEVISESEFQLVNGWSVSKNLNKLLKGKLLKDKIMIESK